MRQQLIAMGSRLFEISAVPPKHRRDELEPRAVRTWDAAKVLQAMDYMRRLNHEIGLNILIRPAAYDRVDPQDGIEAYEGHLALPLCFVDDLDIGRAGQMADDGLGFAVLIESSPSNYQGWVRIAGYPIERRVLSAANKTLARLYGGDPGSTDWRHNSRLVSFLNLKLERRDAAGQFPMARLTEVNPGIAHAGDEILAAALRDVAEEDALETRRKARAEELRQRWREEQSRHGTQPGQDWRARAQSDPDTAFLEARSRAKGSDQSSLDFAAAMSLANKGVHVAAIAETIIRNSPAITERHPKDYRKYAEHTARRAAERAQSKPRM